jgi:hypothetical protein
MRPSGRRESIDAIIVGRRLRKYLPGSDTTWMFGQYCIHRSAFAVSHSSTKAESFGEPVAQPPADQAAQVSSQRIKRVFG